jgi:hypothetical protein
VLVAQRCEVYDLDEFESEASERVEEVLDPKEAA